jgi:plastocyanin
MIARPAASCPGGSLSKVQIAAGTSSRSVLVCGVSAGRVTLVAQDSASVFLPDTLVVTVVSTIEFREIGQFSRQQNFYVNKNETHQAQVFLSDPAPAGGLGVTFVYGRAGTSTVLPSPAIIPAGQLSANVTIQGLAVGTDSVVPTSGGFVGKFSRVIVASNNLALQRPYPYTGTLGVGQTFQPYVGITYAMDHHLVISATLGSAIGTVQSPDTIRAGSSIQYFTVTATAPGRTALTVTASGWVSAADTFTFTTPHLRAFGPSSIVAGDPSRAYWSAYAGDSIGYDHLVKDTLVVTAVSRNPAAVVVDSATLRIPAGSSGATRSNAVRALATAGGDSAWVVVTASGYTADSFLVRVTKPTLTTQLSYPYTGRIGLGTLFQNAGYVDLPYARPDTFTVTFGHSAAARVRGPATVRIPPSQTRAYFTLVGDALGVDTMFVDTVATPGYVVAGSPLVYQVDSLHVGLYTYPSGTNYTIAAPSPVTVYAYDPVDGQARPLIAPLRVNLASSDTATFTLDSAAVTIDSGQFHSVNHPDTLRFRGVDTVGARILTSAPGSTPDSSGLIRVFPTPLGIQLGYPYTVGRGLRLKSNYVYVTGGSVPDTVKVALRRFDPTLDTLTADTVRILKGQSVSQPFEIWALDSLRTDSIVATAVGYVPAKVSITPEAVSLVQAGLPATRATTDPPYRASVYTATRSRNVLNPFVPVNVAVVSTDPNVMQIDSAGVLNARGDTAVAVVDSNRAFGQVRVRFVGNGTARLRYSAPGFLGDSTVLVTVTGPALNLTTGSQTLGVGQLLPSQYVYVNNPVTDSALVVHLLRSDSTQPPANQVFRLSTDSVIIPVGQTISTLFDIEGNFTNSAVLTARANGYIQAGGTVSVGAPQLVAPPNLTLYVGQAPVPAYVYTADQGGVQRSVAAALVVQVTSSDTTIVKSDSATVTVPARDLDVLVPLRGRAKGVTTAIFTATGYKADTTAVSVDTAQLSFGSVPASLGPGQTAQVYVALPFTNDSAITVSLVSSDPAVLSVPASVVIPARGASASFTVTGVAAGSATITGSAPGKAKPGTSAAIPVGTPKLQLFFQANTNVGQKYILTVYAEDSLGTARPVATPLTVTLTSSVPTATTFDSSSITIPAGSFSVSTGVTFTQAGSYTLTGTAPGYASANINSNATGALVSMSGTAFVPNSVAIQAGQVVTWRNEDSFNHTTTSDAALWTATLAPAQTYVRTFSTPGTFTYHCNIHPAMTGTVVVNP